MACLQFHKAGAKYKIEIPVVKPEDMTKATAHIPFVVYNPPFLGLYVFLK